MTGLSFCYSTFSIWKARLRSSASRHRPKNWALCLDRRSVLSEVGFLVCGVVAVNHPFCCQLVEKLHVFLQFGACLRFIFRVPDAFDCGSHLRHVCPVALAML